MNRHPGGTAEVTIVSTEQLRRGASESGLPPRPYPGLRPFRIDEWAIFFGREVMIEEVIQRLMTHQVVVLHGSSGCGKSSLIYAGILPQLTRRVGRRKRRLRVAQMRPGRAPLRTMAEALAASLERDDVDDLHRMVARGAAGARDLQLLLAEREDERLCLFVDQFEELFRFARHGSAAEANLFAEFLTGLGSGALDEEEEQAAGAEPPAGRVRLIVTMRSEFLGDCARYPGLAELINRTQYLLPMMTRPDLVRAIREPSELFGVEVSYDLAERLVEDALDESDPLPLMQHALMRLWAEGPEAMTLSRYSELAAGDGDDSCRTGLCRFLSAHANEVLVSVGGREDRVAELLFRSLTDIDAEGRGIRRPQELGRLLALVDPADRDKLLRTIDAFRADDAAFLRPFADERASPLPDGEMIDISHEALLRAWPRIADPAIDPTSGQPHGWLHREIEDGLVWRALAVQAKLFEGNRTAYLDAATTTRREPWFDAFGSKPFWAERHLVVRTGAEPAAEPEWHAVQALMAASRRARTRRRLRRRLTWAALALLVAAGFVILGYLYFGSQRDLDSTRAVANAAQAEAVAEQSAEKSRLVLERETVSTPAGDPDDPPDEGRLITLSGSEEAFIYIGAGNRAMLRDPRTNQPVPPSSVAVMGMYRTSDWLVARAAAADASCSYAAGSGFVPSGSTIQILSAPATCRSGTGVQYWARARVPIQRFATVFIQFFGETADAAALVEAQSESRQRAGRIASALQGFGYRVPPVDRELGAAGLAEIRYFHASDREQAQMLAYNGRQAARRNADLAPLASLRITDMSRSSRRPPVGTLELWLDVGTPTAAAAAAE